MKIKTLSIVAALAASLFVSANAKTESTLKVDRYQAGNQQYAYPITDENAPALTPAPAGYKPVHIESYTRHGSRWLIGKTVYTGPVATLQRADSLGQLTEDGKKLLQKLIPIAKASKGRDGELTPLGHRQHRGIARRIMKNFPELFTDSTKIDAKSTVIIRCILSMANEIAEMQMAYPNMDVHIDATRLYQDTLAGNGLDTVAKRLYNENRRLAYDLRDKIDGQHPAFINRIFKDAKFATDSLDAEDLYEQVFDIAVNAQSHDNLYDLYEYFTDEDLRNGWEWRNAKWYVRDGNSALTGYRTPYMQAPLLRNIINSVDTIYGADHPILTMRFGHDSIVVPLAVLMDLGWCTYDTSDLTTLAENWQDFNITPMAANIQMIFYGPENEPATLDNMLVKIMLNEHEMPINAPIKAVSGPYYRWKDLRQHYLNKINNIPDVR